MATAYVDTTDAATQKLWSDRIAHQTSRNTVLFNPKYGLIGEKGTVVNKKNDLKQKKGDRVRFTLFRQLKQKPTVGDATLEGFEEASTWSTYDITIDVLRHAVAVRNIMSLQRAPFNILKENTDLIAEYFGQVLEIGGFIHLCSYTATTGTNAHTLHGTQIVGNDVAWSMNILPRAPDSQSIIRPGSHATDQAVGGDTSATMDTDLVDKANNYAKLRENPIRPILVNRKPYWVWFLHVNQVRDMKSSGSEFYQILQDSMRGGKVDDNPIFTGSLGTYGGNIFYETAWSTPGVHSTTAAPVADTRRAVMCGQDALCWATGRGGDHGEFDWILGDKDYKQNWMLAGTTMTGLSAPAFTYREGGTLRDHGKIVVTTYARDESALVA